MYTKYNKKKPHLNVSYSYEQKYDDEEHKIKKKQEEKKLNEKKKSKKIKKIKNKRENHQVSLSYR